MRPLPRRAVLAAASTPAFAARAAEAWPTRPIRMIVPFAPGGGADVVARFVADPIAAELGQPVIVENRGGAGGAIGTQAVAQAPADGYTLLYGTPGPLVTNPILMPRLPYDAARDFAPVSLLTQGAYVMAVNADLPVRSVPDLIALAKARPGQLTYSSSGIGAGSHLAGALLCIQAGIDMVHVPFRGSGPAIQEVASGRVSLAIDTYGIMVPLIESGRLRPIAATTARRVPERPELPTISETLPGFEVTVFNYLCVRAGTPRPIIERLNQAVVKALAQRALIERMLAAGTSTPVSSTPEALGALLASESAKWRDVIQRAGIRADP
jgi:tripartite-type tricarboxylate transporter receptor subunit TctC